MKKVIFFSVLLFAMGCKKVDVKNQEPQSKNVGSVEKSLTDKELNQKDFEYSHEVTIKGVEGSYVKYLVQSNDQGVVASMVKDLENSSIKLLDDEEMEKSLSNPNEINEQINYEEVPYDFDKGVHLVELERNINSHKGYGVVMPKITKKVGGYLNSYSTITLKLTKVAGVYVRNLWMYPNYNYHFFNGGTPISVGGTPDWVLDQVVTLLYYQEQTFTAGGVNDHYLVINPSYISDVFEYNNKIYWSVWP